MGERALEDQLNGRDRPPIGTHETEKVRNSYLCVNGLTEITRLKFADRLITSLINKKDFDSAETPMVKLESSDRKPVITMDSLGRFDIVKSRLY